MMKQRRLGRVAGALVVLAVALALLASGCKRRDEIAEPDLSFDKPPRAADATETKLDDSPSAKPAHDAVQTRPASKPTETPVAQAVTAPPTALPVAPQPAAPPAPDLETLLRRAQAYAVSAKTAAGSEVPGVRIGLKLVTQDGPFANDTYLHVGPLAYALLARFADSRLAVWGRTDGDLTNAETGLCDAPPKLGDSLYSATPGAPSVILESRVAYVGIPAPNAGSVSTAAQVVVLDRPAVADLAGALLLDAAGRVCGLVTATATHGLMTAVGVDELRLWQGPGVNGIIRSAAAPAQPDALAGDGNLPSDETTNSNLNPDAPTRTETPSAETPPARANERLWLGAVVENLSPALRAAHRLPESVSGVLVARVHEQSPAQYAGMRSGDLLLAFGQTPVQRVAQLPDLMAQAAEGQVLTLSVLRDGAPLTLQPVVARRP